MEISANNVSNNPPPRVSDNTQKPPEANQSDQQVKLDSHQQPEATQPTQPNDRLGSSIDTYA
jgi:cell division protein FtsN